MPLICVEVTYCIHHNNLRVQKRMFSQLPLQNILIQKSLFVWALVLWYCLISISYQLISQLLLVAAASSLYGWIMSVKQYNVSQFEVSGVIIPIEKQKHSKNHHIHMCTSTKQYSRPVHCSVYKATVPKDDSTPWES